MGRSEGGMLARDRPEEMDRLGEGGGGDQVEDEEDEGDDKFSVTLPSPADLPRSQGVEVGQAAGGRHQEEVWGVNGQLRMLRRS